MTEETKDYGIESEADKKKARKDKITSAGLILFMVGMFIGITFMFVSDDREDKITNELEVSEIEDAKFGETVKIHGRIECDYKVAISADWDDDDWDGDIKVFYLNDTKNVVKVKPKGGYRDPEIDVNEAPHEKGEYEQYYDGDTAYIVGDYKNSSGVPTIYMRAIAKSPDGFYRPNENLFLASFMMFGCGFLISLFPTAISRSKKESKLESKWKSRPESSSEWQKTGGYSMVAAMVLGGIFYYYMLFEFYYLLPILLAFIFLLLLIAFYIKNRRAMVTKDYQQRTIGGKLTSGLLPVEAVKKLLEDNGIYHTYTKGKKPIISLDQYDMTIKFQPWGLFKDKKNFKGSNISVIITVGPITPQNQYTMGNRLKYLMDKEFDKKKWGKKIVLRKRKLRKK